MTRATDLTADLKAAIRDALRGAVDLAHIEKSADELCRALDVVIAAHRAECFARSPSSDYLRANDDNTIKLYVGVLGDICAAVIDERGRVHEVGHGASAEEAVALCLNRLESRGEKGAGG